MQTSLKNPEKLDLVTFDATNGECALVISAMDDWSDSEEEQAHLLQKLNNYLRFIIDGELTQRYPQTKGKPVRIQIDTVSTLPPNANQVITQAQDLLLPHGVRLCVNRIA